MAALLALVAERGVQRIVIGLPLSLSGGDTMQTRETRDFVRRLTHKLGESVPVELHDERFTTRMAQQIPGAASSEHSRAAALLLEGWLAEWNRNGSAPSAR
jgi:putative Holliday junction resolvase